MRGAGVVPNAVQTRRIGRIRESTRKVWEREQRAERPLVKRTLSLGRWALLLYHEYVRDDVRVRAESLSFLMLLSLLPLVAGVFFVFSLFSQIGMVQDALQDLVQRFLSTIPVEHRTFVADYVLKFKDAYLGSITKKSGTLGIFAFGFLVYVGMSTFQNVDRMLNSIWASDRERPTLETLRNFLVTAVAAPVVLIAALSIPQILRRSMEGAALGKSVSGGVIALLNWGLMPALVFGTFLAMYRLIPVRHVYWKSAAAGAAFTTVGLSLVNSLMGIYFKYGTTSAYGKAAVVPLVAFWVYVVWIVVILGAELSYLMQNARDIIESSDREATLTEGLALLESLAVFSEAHRTGENPVSFERLRRAVFPNAPLEADKLRTVVRYLEDRGFVARSFFDGAGDAGYLLARDLEAIPVQELLREFFGVGKSDEEGLTEPLAVEWHKSVRRWIESFGDVSVPELARRRPTTPG
jgi:membrane protein